MTIKQHLMWPVALVAMIAIVPLAGCGGDTATTAGTATVTVSSIPNATVTINGEAQGTTPLTLDLPPGPHDITFAADGFVTITEKWNLVKGEDTKVEHYLALDSVDDDRIATVAKELGIDTQAFEAPGTHRGGDDTVFTQYWPRGKVRLEALSSFRLDVGDRYGDDVPLASVVFKKGSKVIHVIEEFDPATPITIADMPSEVISQLKPGSSFTWGLDFKHRKFKKLSDKVKVSVVGKAEAKKVEKTVAKIKDKKYFKRQDPVVQDTLLAQTLENKRLYTEALLSYIRILESNPGVTSPFKGVVTTLRRMDLDESGMFQAASVFVGGRGGRSGVNKQAGAGNSALAGNGPNMRDKQLAAITGPKGSTSKGYNPGGRIDVDPNAKAPVNDSGSGESKDGSGGGNDASTGGGQASSGGASNDPSTNGPSSNDPSSNDPRPDDPSSNDPSSNDPSHPGDPGKPAVPASPIDATAQAAEQTQQLRDQLAKVISEGNATPAEVQAMHQALQDSEAALAKMQATADQAASGDATAKEVYDKAQQDYQNAQKAAQAALPNPDPNQYPDPNPGQSDAPQNMEQALQQLAQSGNAPPGASQLYNVLKTNREAQEDAAATQNAADEASTAVQAAEKTLRELDQGATQVEKDAASEAVKAARDAHEAAVQAADAAREKAEELKGAADKAVDRFADAAQQAQEILKTK